METNLFKYYTLGILIILGFFTFIIPVAYHAWTGNGWFTLIDIAMEKYHPDLYNKPNRRTFFTKWY